MSLQSKAWGILKIAKFYFQLIECLLGPEIDGWSLFYVSVGVRMCMCVFVSTRIVFLDIHSIVFTITRHIFENKHFWKRVVVIM